MNLQAHFHTYLSNSNEIPRHFHTEAHFHAKNSEDFQKQTDVKPPGSQSPSNRIWI